MHPEKNVKNAILCEINLQIDAEQLNAKTENISLFRIKTHIIHKHKLSLPWLTINVIDFYHSKNKKTESNKIYVMPPTHMSELNSTFTSDDQTINNIESELNSVSTGDDQSINDTVELTSTQNIG